MRIWTADKEIASHEIFAFGFDSRLALNNRNNVLIAFVLRHLGSGESGLGQKIA
jgi:hypothetical protein